MKKLITTLLLLVTLTTFSQDKRFTFGIFTEPGAFSDGFNIGAEIEYQMELMYLKAGIYTFPNLNNVGYTQIYGVPLGVNFHSKFDEWRAFTGLQLGVNIREGNPNPIAGLEAGIERYFGNLFIGLQGNYIRRSDAEFYGGNDWVFNGQVKIGIAWQLVAIPNSISIN
jgi:hypothetical protein